MNDEYHYPLNKYVFEYICCLIHRFSDLFMRHMKFFLLVMFALAAGSFVWFTLLCVKVIPFSTGK